MLASLVLAAMGAACASMHAGRGTIFVAGEAARVTAPAPSRLPPASHLFAIGDVHGDLSAARAALRLTGTVDVRDRWIGGEAVVVQTADQLDRGDDDRAVLDLFDRLAVEAAAAGGAFISLNGNHELMNVLGDVRYVTEEGFRDFVDVEELDLDEPSLQAAPELQRARLAAFRPGGPYARRD